MEIESRSVHDRGLNATGTIEIYVVQKEARAGDRMDVYAERRDPPA